jgi:hypothetical protein
MAVVAASCASGGQGAAGASCRTSSDCAGGAPCRDGRCAPSDGRDAGARPDGAVLGDAAVASDAASAPDGPGPVDGASVGDADSGGADLGGTDAGALDAGRVDLGAGDAGIGACRDGMRGPGEADVDCGGSCPACSDGRMCGAPGDCASGTCEGGRCRRCTTTAPTWSTSGTCGGWGTPTVRQVEVTGPTTMRIRSETYTGDFTETCDTTVTLSGATWSTSGTCGGWGTPTVRQVEVTGPTTMRIRSETYTGDFTESCDVIVTLVGTRTCT